MLETDSGDYEVLHRAAEMTVGVPGLIAEIGTRRGGSMRWIIDGLRASQQFNRTLLCIDPYGNIPYPHGDGRILINDYDNNMKNDAHIGLYTYVRGSAFNLIMVTLEDTEFFRCFEWGYPVYADNKKTIVNEYALVYFDGPHEPKAVLEETIWFAARAPIGAIFCYDDWQDFTFTSINEWLVNNGWVQIESSQKKLNYKRVT